MTRYPALRVVETLAATSRNPKYVRLIEARRGRAQIEKGVARLAFNGSVEQAIECLEQQLEAMRTRLPKSKQQREQQS